MLAVAGVTTRAVNGQVRIDLWHARIGVVDIRINASKGVGRAGGGKCRQVISYHRGLHNPIFYDRINCCSIFDAWRLGCGQYAESRNRRGNCRDRRDWLEWRHLGAATATATARSEEHNGKCQSQGIGMVHRTTSVMHWACMGWLTA